MIDKPLHLLLIQKLEDIGIEIPSAKSPKHAIHVFFGHVFTQSVINYQLFPENGESINIILRKVSINSPFNVELKPVELVTIRHLLVNMAIHFLLSWNSVFRSRKFLCGKNIFNLNWRAILTCVSQLICRAQLRERYSTGGSIFNHLAFLWFFLRLGLHLFV